MVAGMPVSVSSRPESREQQSTASRVETAESELLRVGIEQLVGETANSEGCQLSVAESSGQPHAASSVMGTEGSSSLGAHIERVLGEAVEVGRTLSAESQPQAAASMARTEESSLLRVAVKQLLGETFEVALPRSSTVDDLKAAIQDLTGIQAGQQVIGHRGWELQHGFATLLSQGVVQDPEVSLLLLALRKVRIRAWEGSRCKDQRDLFYAEGAHLQEELELSVLASISVGEVKRLIHRHWPHCSVAEMSLHLNAHGISDPMWRAPIENLALKDHCTLENLSLRSEGFLCVATGRAWKATQTPLLVRVKPLSGALRKVSLPSSSIVDDLKVAIQDAFGILVPEQILGHRGQTLADGSSTLHSLGFGSDAEVVSLLERPPLHRIVVRAWEGAKCAETESFVPDGVHLQRELELFLLASTTVGEIKDLIRERWQHYRLADLSLHLNARGIGDPNWRAPIDKLALDNHSTLESLRLRTEGFICAATTSERRVRLQFSPGAAMPLDIKVSADCSVHDLKRMITEMPGIPGYALKIDHIRLILSPGTPLEGGVAGSGTLADYNVQEGATILCLPVAGPCFGRPSPTCSALSGPYRCRCGSRDPKRLPALDQMLPDRAIAGTSKVSKPFEFFRLPPPQQLHGKTTQVRKHRPRSLGGLAGGAATS